MTRNPTLTLLAAAVFALAGCASTAPRTAPAAVVPVGVAVKIYVEEGLSLTANKT